MLTKPFTISVCLAASIVFASVSGPALESAKAASVLAPFVNDDTVGALYVDVGTATDGGGFGKLVQLLPKEAGDHQSLMLGAMLVDGLVHRVQQAGVAGLYIVGGLGDVRMGGGPVSVVTTRSGGDPQKVEQVLRDIVGELSSMLGQAAGTNGKAPADAFRQQFGFEFDVARKGDVVLFGPKSSVARYAALKSSPRAELVEPLAKLIDDGAKIGAVFCPGADYRRVSRELWPQLPGVLAPFRGELADRWLRFELDMKPPHPRLMLVTKDADAAAIFAQLWRDLPTATTEFGGNKESREMAKGYAQLLVDSLPVTVEGAKATIEIPADEARIAKLRAMLGEAADKSMAVGNRRTRMDQFKHLMLAMLNYESSNKHLPPAAIRDKDGKPLLSWRVAILPFLDEIELYKQFHLDEPWDSPHNIALVTKMPDAYADPGRKLAAFARDGKTTYQVPVGPETTFFNSEGAFIREIKDGLANTVLVVERDPSHAVIWTKPEDWNVDLAKPRTGLERSDRDYVTLGFADGHVQVIDPAKIDEKMLRAFFTRAGGDTADQP
jgi:hypothetical protein